MDRDLVDRIVKRVLRELGTQAVDVRPVGDVAHAGSVNGDGNTVRLQDAVVTAALLADCTSRGCVLEVATKTVLTPSARDVVRSRGMTVRRIAAGESNEKHDRLRNSAGCFIVDSTPALAQLLDDIGLCSRTFDCPDDAAEMAADSIEENAGTNVVIFAGLVFRVAMLANRHAKVRAAAVSDAADVKAASKQIRPNVWCVEPCDRSYFELRTLMRLISAT